nr:methyltransferase [Kribbella sindirgiensis]
MVAGHPRDRRAAARRSTGLGDRVTFSVADATTQNGQFDLVTILEALHDMPRPVDALRTARQMLAPGGTVLIADELVEEEFIAPATDAGLTEVQVHPFRTTYWRFYRLIP